MVTLLSGNQKKVKSETGDKSKNANASPQILGRNRLFIVLFFLVSLGITSFQFITELILSIRDQIAAWVSAMNQVEDQVKPPEQSNSGEKNPNFMDIDDAEGSAFWTALGDIMYTITSIVVVIIVLLIVWLIAKKLRQLFKLWVVWFKQRLGIKNKMETTHIGFIDEKENTFNLNKITQVFKKAKDLFKNNDKWSDQSSNLEKVRFIYRTQIFNALKKGYTFKAQLTPNEIIKDIQQWNQEYISLDEISKNYNRSRYGKQHIHDDIVEQLRQQSNIKKN